MFDVSGWTMLTNSCVVVLYSTCVVFDLHLDVMIRAETSTHAAGVRVAPAKPLLHCAKQAAGAHHVAEHGTDSEEALRRGADVVQADIVQQYLLHDEGGDGFAQLAAHLHGAQAQRDDLRGQQEVDDLRVVHLRASHGSQPSAIDRLI